MILNIAMNILVNALLHLQVYCIPLNIPNYNLGVIIVMSFAIISETFIENIPIGALKFALVGVV